MGKEKPPIVPVFLPSVIARDRMTEPEIEKMCGYLIQMAHDLRTGHAVFTLVINDYLFTHRDVLEKMNIPR